MPHAPNNNGSRLAAMTFMQTKQLDVPFQLKAAPDADGRFEGFGAVFHNTDSFDEVILPGAFKMSLADYRRQGRMPALLWQHDPRAPIGVWESLDETQDGLMARGRLLLDLKQGREAHILLKAGALDGLSVGFRTLKSEVDDRTGIRTLTEIELFEISLVTFPANARARVTAVKTGTIASPREFERTMRALGFTKRQARILVARGYRAMAAADGAGDEAPGGPAGDPVAGLIDSIERAGLALTDRH